MADYTYNAIDKTNPFYNAYLGTQGLNYNKLKGNFGDEDDTNDMYYQKSDGTYAKIDPSKLTVNPAKVTYTGRRGHRRKVSTPLWMTYDPGDGTASFQLAPDKIFWAGTLPDSRLTNTAGGAAFRLNSNSAPAPTVNNGAYTYKEWQEGTPWGNNYDGLQSLSNIYGNIDTADEFKIVAGLNLGLRDYVNSNYIVGNKKKSLFGDDGSWTGNDNDIAGAASLINKYLTTDAKGKEYANQLMRGQASLSNIDRYKAYDAAKGWEDGRDRDYLNRARNSVDKRYNGANFFKKYAGDKTWGTLANQFAQNDIFEKDYTVNAQHVMDRLNRNAGNGRPLIAIYNDIINKGGTSLSPQQLYDIFRDMTRRRFKLDDNFWNRHGLSGIRNQVYGTEDVIFKDGGQIFRMLFV